MVFLLVLIYLFVGITLTLKVKDDTGMPYANMVDVILMVLLSPVIIPVMLLLLSTEETDD